MTLINQMEFNCPFCGHPGTTNIYSSVNVTLDPELKEKVLDGSLFKVNCEKCGQELGIPEETLYNDVEARLMVYLHPRENQPYWRETVDDLDGAFDFVLEGHAGEDPILETYTLRVCFGLNELIEKILIHDAGLDDGIVEIAKVLAIASSGDDSTEEVPIILFSEVLEDGVWEFVCIDPDTGQTTETFALSREGVEAAAAENAGAFDFMLQPPYVSYMKMFEELTDDSS